MYYYILKNIVLYIFTSRIYSILVQDISQPAVWSHFDKTCFESPRRDGMPDFVWKVRNGENWFQHCDHCVSGSTFDMIFSCEPPQKPRQYQICIGRTLVDINFLKSLETRGKQRDLSKLAIPLFKAMSSFFHNIHVSHTQIGHSASQIYTNIYIYVFSNFLQAIPPKFTIYRYCTTCGKRCDFSLNFWMSFP